MSKGKVSDLCAWEPPPPQNARERFWRGNPHQFENNTPKTFSSQFNFGRQNPSSQTHPVVTAGPRPKIMGK
jgi:hypothetical protein